MNFPKPKNEKFEIKLKKCEKNNEPKSLEFYMSQLDKSIQSGYQSKKELPKSDPANESHKDSDSIKTDDKPSRRHKLEYEELNKMHDRYRSGYQVYEPNADKVLNYKHLALKGNINEKIYPQKLKGRSGNEPVGYSGWKRQELFYAKYNMDGQGPIGKPTAN